MSPATPLPACCPKRTAINRWRGVFVAYGVLLTVATHWPALDIGSEEVPAADKALHLYAFGLGTLLLQQTRWIKTAPLLWLVGLAWILMDEWTQAMPILERQFSTLDVLAGGLGVTVACAWIAALRPVGGAANRHRIAIQHHVAARIFGGPLHGPHIAAWLLVGALLAQVGLGLLFVLPSAISRLPNMVPAMGYAAAQAVVIGLALLVFNRVWRRTLQVVCDTRSCPSCGRPETCAEFDLNGRGACQRCGAGLHIGMWLPSAWPDSARLRRFLQWPAAAAICILGAGAGLFLGAVALYRVAIDTGQHASVALQAARNLHGLPDDFILAVDLSLLLLALAVMAWMYRRNLARWHDRQHLECRRCGYDLRATPRARGVGACPECGSAFSDY